VRRIPERDRFPGRDHDQHRGGGGRQQQRRRDRRGRDQ
jgi:hypothetical protein